MKRSKTEQLSHSKRGWHDRCSRRLEEHPTSGTGQPYCEFKLIKKDEQGNLVEGDPSDTRTKENELAWRHVSLLPEHLR